jgi:Amt family ammonium transporter
VDSISAIDTVWVLLCAVLVFFMNTGFALLEAGFCRAKNTVNILTKNLIVFAIASLAFFAVGFGFMFGEGSSFIGLTGFAPAFDGSDVAATPANLPMAAFFFFQLVFAATAATIVSGAVAERIKLGAFMLFSVVLVAVVYPIVGHWAWGGGLLSDTGFHDFAGSTVVHSVGGWAALAGVVILGPRLGKFGKDGKARAIPGHSMALATAGGLILWMGWFGFNPGSVLSADGPSIAHVALTTNMSAAAGAVAACLVAWWKIKAPDLSMIINGALAGLVAITAGTDVVSPLGAITIGSMAGVLVVFAVLFFDRVRIDDPVGAISVHLVCGVFGTVMTGLFAAKGDSLGLLYGGGAELLVAQLKGVGLVGAFTLAASGLVWMGVKAVVGMRVPEEDELVGLDISEMKMEAYPADPTSSAVPSHAAFAAAGALRAELPGPVTDEG